MPGEHLRDARARKSLPCRNFPPVPTERSPAKAARKRFSAQRETGVPFDLLQLFAQPTTGFFMAPRRLFPPPVPQNLPHSPPAAPRSMTLDDLHRPAALGTEQRSTSYTCWINAAQRFRASRAPGPSPCRFGISDCHRFGPQAPSLIEYQLYTDQVLARSGMRWSPPKIQRTNTRGSSDTNIGPRHENATKIQHLDSARGQTPAQDRIEKLTAVSTGRRQKP